jgi:plastocyanin
MVAVIGFALAIGAWASAAFADGSVQMTEGSISDINSWAFTPPELTIEAGQSVTWTNSGSQAHSATADGGGFDTGLIQPDNSKTVSLTTPGTYAYHCTPHPWMKGTITVLAAAAAPAPAAAPPPAAPAAAPPAAAAPAVQAQATPTPFRFATPFISQPVTSTTATTTTPAPRAGGVPLELAAPLLAAAAGALGGGAYLLRRGGRRN